MGLAARVLEAHGVATVAVGVVRSVMTSTRAPRNVCVRFRLGRIFGEPDDPAQQRTVLREALHAVITIASPGGFVDLPYRWKRETYES